MQQNFAGTILNIAVFCIFDPMLCISSVPYFLLFILLLGMLLVLYNQFGLAFFSVRPSAASSYPPPPTPLSCHSVGSATGELPFDVFSLIMLCVPYHREVPTPAVT